MFGGFDMPAEWWFYHRGTRRERLRYVGPEPLGPYLSREAAKAAGEGLLEDLARAIS